MWEDHFCIWKSKKKNSFHIPVSFLVLSKFIVREIEKSLRFFSFIEIEKNWKPWLEHCRLLNQVQYLTCSIIHKLFTTFQKFIRDSEKYLLICAHFQCLSWTILVFAFHGFQWNCSQYFHYNFVFDVCINLKFNLFWDTCQRVMKFTGNFRW
jgi:hypothetical protein